MRLERRSFKISFSFSFTDELEGPETPVNIVWCLGGGVNVCDCVRGVGGTCRRLYVFDFLSFASWENPSHP